MTTAAFRELKPGDVIQFDTGVSRTVKQSAFCDAMVGGNGFKAARALDVVFEDGYAIKAHPADIVTLLNR